MIQGRGITEDKNVASFLTIRKYFLTVGCFLLIAIVVFLITPTVGAEKINPIEALKNWSEGKRTVDVDILIYLRLPRIILGFLAGASLSLAGVVFQGLLRNPLTTPYTLGIASGGSLGAVIALYTSISFSLGPIYSVQLFALLGSGLTLIIIYLLAREEDDLSSVNLLLGGVTIGLVSSSMILFVRYLAKPEELIIMDRWLMGGLDIAGYADLNMALPFTLIGIVILFGQGWKINQLAMGDEMAAGRGINVKRLQCIILFAGSLATAGVVAVTGPIGFVGLIVPHSVRRIVGEDHRLLIPCSLLAGGSFLVLCDTVARIIIAPTELPVGIITSLLGGPFFILLLIRRRKGWEKWVE